MTAPLLRADELAEAKLQIKALQERLDLVEATLQALIGQKAPEPAKEQAQAIARTAMAQAQVTRREVLPPELIPEIGKIGAEVGVMFTGSSNPFYLARGIEGAGFIDLPLIDKPDWLHGKISYEILVGLSQSKTRFSTTSNVAQVANLTVLNAVNPGGGLQNVTDALSGTGAAPFPVTAMTETKLRLLQVVPFSLKYTTTVLDRFRVRPYAVVGFGAYVTIHNQTPSNSGVRTDANLPAAVIGLVNASFGGKAPFGGPLVAGQISQSPELESRGLPSGHGSIDFGLHTGAGVEYRMSPTFSVGFDARFNRIAGAPGLLTTYGTRLGVHF